MNMLMTQCTNTIRKVALMNGHLWHQGCQLLRHKLKRHKYLKLGFGVMVGVDPSMIPLSLTVRTPPGSSKAFKRSSTDGLHRENPNGGQAGVPHWLLPWLRPLNAPDPCLPFSKDHVPVENCDSSKISFPINARFHSPRHTAQWFIHSKYTKCLLNKSRKMIESSLN